jgi:chaperonin cofactor prefoldin
LNYADLTHIHELGFTMHDINYGWYTHDWRKRPPLVWLELMGKREIEMVDQYDEASAEAVSILVLSQDEFDTSVQHAIRNYHQTDQLLNNPLLKSRLVLKMLKHVLDQALKEIELSPVDGKYYRILYRTFINPVGSQEKVADYLNMSFSTYRRYLKSAMDKLVRLMWNMEVNLN